LGGFIQIVKGAPEEILAVSSHYLQHEETLSLDSGNRSRVLEQSTQMASGALRVLAVAFREVSDELEDWRVESNLIFVGLIGMIDPPRRAAKEAVDRCRKAGIRPVMITGDHPETAIAIAKEIGIAELGAVVLMGSVIERISEDELESTIMGYSVVARVTAEHKLRVVNAWKKNGHVVAMTGDGVNDAPAVKAADIGVVMGIAGTDVAKEAADMILIDDNFVSIVNAVEEGRGVYENIRKFLQFLLACNSSEVIFMFTATLIGWPSPLLAIQILWINLITDGIPALALASEPLGKELMKQPPRPKDEPILNWQSGQTMLVHGLLMAAMALIGFGFSYQGNPANLEEAQAVAFCVLTLSQIFYSFACRDLDRIMPSVGLFTNPFLVMAVIGSVTIQLAAISIPWSADILALDAMPWSDLPIILLLSLLPVTLVELKKLFRPSLAFLE
jgi:P-type Ca2+ transporter type 2C